MSLWRVRHGLSPVVEKSLVALAALTGALAIYLASVEPLVVSTTAGISNLPGQVTVDTDQWSRHGNVAYGYQYGVPPGWKADETDLSRVVIAGSSALLRAFPDASRVLSVEVRKLGERRQAENIAAEDFAGRRAALYDVAVDGYEGLFAVSFQGSRADRQAVYVARGGLVYIFRGDRLDPAVFSAFVSTIRFFIP